MDHSQLGLIGLAVMGQNLALNAAGNGFRVSVYNRTAETTRAFMAGRGGQADLRPCFGLEELVQSLEPPRRVFLMVKAGPAVDAVIQDLIPLLSPGDLIMDGGNSLFLDTERRFEEVTAKGLDYLGVGVSGGEEGALKGPSMMPGGSREAYQLMEPVFRAMAARAQGEPCVDYMGSGGAGHLVKMVHNGIEYGDMQLIAEAYDLLHRGLGLSAPELHRTFSLWNRSELSSYLIEITADIFRVRDEGGDEPLVEMILDSAGQKGTGRWTVQTALEMGVAVPTITAAVEARIMSSQKLLRQEAAPVLPGPTVGPGPGQEITDDLKEALYAAKICSYAQGFDLLRAADQAHGFGLDLAAPAKVWRAGCIIRSVFLDDVHQALRNEPEMSNLLLAPFFSQAMEKSQAALRRVVALAAETGIAAPGLTASLAYYDSLRSARLPANLIQAQRDFFGAHGYERIDREGTFHTPWLAALKKD